MYSRQISFALNHPHSVRYLNKTQNFSIQHPTLLANNLKDSYIQSPIYNILLDWRCNPTCPGGSN